MLHYLRLELVNQIIRLIKLFVYTIIRLNWYLVEAVSTLGFFPKIWGFFSSNFGMPFFISKKSKICQRFTQIDGIEM